MLNAISGYSENHGWWDFSE